MAKKKDKYDILADAVVALCDFNTKIEIETLDARDSGAAFSWYGDNVPYIPTRRAKNTLNGIVSFARIHAKSIKIGRDISIKRIHRKRTRVKIDEHEYEVDNGYYYLVRTPKGEAQFGPADEDFLAVWLYALSIHDGIGSHSSFRRKLRNEKLKKIAYGPKVLKDEKSNKYTDAIKRLKALGIEPKKLMEYIQKKGAMEM